MARTEENNLAELQQWKAKTRTLETIHFLFLLLHQLSDKLLDKKLSLKKNVLQRNNIRNIFGNLAQL